MKPYTRFTVEQIMQCKENVFMMEELIKNSERLISKVARGYYIKDMELDDLMSVGRGEIYKAVYTYNKDLGADFYTYATQCIMNKYMKLFKDSKAKKRGGLGAFATKEEIQNEEFLVSRVVSLDRMSDDGESILDKLKDSTNVHYEGTNFEGWNFLINKKVLTKKELSLLKRIYMEDHLPANIAKEWGVSRQSVSKLHRLALSKIKERYSEQQLATLLGV